MQQQKMLRDSMFTSVTSLNGGNRKSVWFAATLNTEQESKHLSFAKGAPATLVSVLMAALRPITHHDPAYIIMYNVMYNI